jgi:hypothetical protein
MELKKITDQHKFLIIGLTAFCVLYYVLYRQMHTNESVAPKTFEKVQADTFIPAGFVLVPIKLENNEAVSGLIDQFAVVDVYANNPSSKMNELVAEKVKMLRAPLDPNQFAVLLKDEKARELLQLNGRFSVVLQNRHVVGAITEVQETLDSNKSHRLNELHTATKVLANTSLKMEPSHSKPPQIIKVKVEYAKSAL